MGSTENSQKVFDERGIITRIYVENFVTYDKVIVRPGRHLNLIIGPNGTGKSTIVCAIVLGLGGKPNVIGRGSLLSQYIRTGCDYALIEIDLKDKNHKEIKIVRRFTTDSKNTWAVNGVATKDPDVQKLVQSLNIQVSNLCQFLPQDKVQDFSKMNSQQLLENTEKSVGDPILLEYHTRLIKFRSRAKEIEQILEKKGKLLATETQKYEGMKEVVASLKEKKRIKKKIETLKQKRAWMSYDISRKELVKAKAGRDLAAEEMKQLDEQIKPIKAAIQKLENQISALKKSTQEHNSHLGNKASKINKLLEEVQSQEVKVREIERNREHRIKTEKNRDKEIDSVKLQKNKLDNDLKAHVEDVGAETSLKAAEHELHLKMEKTRRETDKLMGEFNDTRVDNDQIGQQIRSLNADIQGVKDVGAKRLELLRARSASAYKGVLWLRQNLDKFRAKIHEPMLVTIDVKEAAFSKYLEQRLPYRDIIAFICEDKADMNLLINHLNDQQRLQVNVIHWDPHRQVGSTPDIPMDSLRRFGFQHYLIDLFDAPKTIVNFLIHNYNIHNIPIGSDAVDNNIKQIPPLRLFYSEKNSYRISKSRYTGAQSTSVMKLMGNGNFSILMDKGQMGKLTERLARLEEKKVRIAETMKSIEDKMKKSTMDLDEAKGAKKKLQHDLQIFDSLRARIKMAERQINNLEKERASIEEINSACTAEIQKVLKNQLEAYGRYNVQMSECHDFITKNQESKFKLELQTRVCAKKKSETQDLQDKCAIAERNFKALERELAPLREETQRMLARAMESTNNISPTMPKFKPLHDAFEKLPKTLDEIEVALKMAQAKVYYAGNENDIEETFRLFEKTQANMKNLTAEVEASKNEQTTITANIEEIRLLWLNPLQALVQRINYNFSSYFSLMGCAGEVTLKLADNIDDFDQYGIKIRVKFRDVDELQELTRQRQSGGERAVTTAFFMMALQELSRVPFRCVDEINQGMDATNERRVFELLVKIVERENSPQYFFITPKLLPNLKYGEKTTVHCVHNGPFMVSCDEYDTESHCQWLRRNRAQN